MELNEIRGIYSPSYFRIRVATTNDLEPLEKLPPDDLSTYFHFIQDLTTLFGLNTSWNVYDRTVRLIKYAQQSDETLTLPFAENHNLQELNRNYWFSYYNLSAKTPQDIISDKFTITKVAITKRDVKENTIPDELNLFLRIDIKDESETETHFWFGAIAIMETMTYLFQGKFFDTTGTPIFPYKSGIILANHISKKVDANSEFIYALCDVSLFSQFPGLAFYDILQEIENSDVVLNKAEDIYDLGFKYIEKRWGLWDKFENSRDALIHIITSLYGHQAFATVKEWLLHIIDQGYKMRCENPYFMLELYRQTKPVSENLFTIYKRLGSPETMNSEKKRWFAAPDALKEKADQVHTAFLLGFKQIQELLLFGIKNCVLIDHCEGTEPPMPINKFCNSSPWGKANEDPLCPFAALWKSFGLDKKKIEFS